MICPKCGRPVNESAVICPGCDFILDTDFLGGDILDEEHQLRPGQGGIDPAVFNLADAVILGNIGDESSSFETSDSGFHIKQDLGAARLYVSGRSQAVMSPDAVIATIELSVKNVRLTPFEKHVLRFIDGKRAVESIRLHAGLDEAEVKTALATLADKGVVKVVGRALADADFDVETAPGQAPKRPARRMRGTLVGAVVVVGDDADQAIDEAFRTRVRAEVPADVRSLEVNDEPGDVFSSEVARESAEAAQAAGSAEPSRTNEVRPLRKPPTSSTATIRPLQGRQAVNAGGGPRTYQPPRHIPVLSDVDRSEIADEPESGSLELSDDGFTVHPTMPGSPHNDLRPREGKQPAIGFSSVDDLDHIDRPKLDGLADSRVIARPAIAAPPPLLSGNASQVSAFGRRDDSLVESHAPHDGSGSVWETGTQNSLISDGQHSGRIKRELSTSLSALLGDASAEFVAPMRGKAPVAADLHVSPHAPHDEAFDSDEEPTSVREPPVRKNPPARATLSPSPSPSPSPERRVPAARSPLTTAHIEPPPPRENAADELFPDDDGELPEIPVGPAAGSVGNGAFASDEGPSRTGASNRDSRDGDGDGEDETGHTEVKPDGSDHTLSPSKASAFDDDRTGILEDDDASQDHPESEVRNDSDDDNTGILEDEEESHGDAGEDSAWSSNTAVPRYRQALVGPEPSRLDSVSTRAPQHGRSTGFESVPAGSGSSEVVESAMVVRPKLQVMPLALTGRKPPAVRPAPVAAPDDDDLMVDPDATQHRPALPKSVEGEERKRRREEEAAATGSLPVTPQPGSNRRAPTDDMRKKARNLFEQATQDHAIGRVGAARMNAKLATIYDPENEEYRRVLAEWERPSGEAQARPDYVALYEEAQSREDADDVDGAIAVLERGLRLAPNPAAFHNRIGVLLAMRKRDYEGARDEIQKAIALEPGNAHYRNNLGKVMAKANRRRGDAVVHAR